MSGEYVPAGVDADVESIARVYDYLLGGRNNFAVDREFAADLKRDTPHLPQLVRDNRAFLVRLVRHCVQDLGIRQFLDIGTGLPTQQNVHEVAQQNAPDARVVYVDNDPMVLAHARALLTSTPEGVTTYIDASAADTGRILGEAAKTLDFSKPMAVLYLAVLHFVEFAVEIVAPIRDAVAPGSALAISHALDVPAMHAAAGKYQMRLNTGVVRTLEDITALFGSFGIVEPGVTALPGWRPDPDERPGPAAGLFVGGVALKPSGSGGAA